MTLLFVDNMGLGTQWFMTMAEWAGPGVGLSVCRSSTCSPKKYRTPSFPSPIFGSVWRRVIIVFFLGLNGSKACMFCCVKAEISGVGCTHSRWLFRTNMG